MDNSGTYVTPAQLLPEIVVAGKGTSKALTLSVKTPTTAPAASFTFAGVSGADLPVVGDWIGQDADAGVITAVSGTTATIDDATDINNGPASLFKLNPVKTRAALLSAIYLSMAFIDRSTRWWFNSRSLTLKVEGANTDVLMIGVPILELTSVTLNEDQTFTGSQITDFFMVPNARLYPDDRRNPRIKIRRDARSVFMDIQRGELFRRSRYQTLVGRYGFLEESGETPLLIQRATAKYAMLKYLDTPGQSASDSADQADRGPLKREKTDIHEIEYYDPSKSTASAVSGKGLAPISGDREIDDILLMYRGPILLGGSFLDEGVEAPRFRGMT